MTDPRDELARLAAATRGALEWHRESGMLEADVANGYEMPDFASAPAGSVQSGSPPPLPVETEQSVAAASAVSPEPMISEAARSALEAAVNASAAVHNAPPPSESLAPAPPKTTPEPPPPPVENSEVHLGPLKAGHKAHALRLLQDEITDFDSEPLSEGATELVFGAGNPDARLMMIGEAPGPQEDEIGLPFVDEAGRLLGRMIRAMGLRRNDVYLTYLVKCRTPGRHPEAWLDAQSEILAREVDIVEPEVIIALGDLAARRLTGREEAFPRLRGQWFEYRGVPIIPTFHPVALLQNPRSKALVWSDLQSVMRRMGLKQSRRS